MKSALAQAANQVGGLGVVQQQVELGDAIETGVVVGEHSRVVVVHKPIQVAITRQQRIQQAAQLGSRRNPFVGRLYQTHAGIIVMHIA